MVTISAYRSRVLALIALLGGLSACVNGASTAMNPDQSRQTLISEAKAVIQAVFPGAEPLVVVQVTDAPCGGPVGTEHSKVESGLNLHFDSPDHTLSSEKVFQKVVDVLKQRGWTINYTSDNVAGAERRGFGGIQAGVGDAPVGINISGTTECVDNPK
ncbi:hypothetical protein AB0B89_01490 [Sphaerisporangium sp. NPDC049002]|uniref:hypothetical protein n=1 Tax=Sphaerisporangium sp. NPDC049002 TaxID=3155392 RepID=UPI0033D34F64